MESPEIFEWRLAVYRCFRGEALDRPVQSDGVSEPPDPASSKVSGETVPGGVWQTIKDHTTVALLVRISEFAHLAVLQGTEVVESYFMILAKKWIKAVLIEDEIMLMIRERGRTRRIRLTFYSEEQAMDCYRRLAFFVSVKQLSIETPLATVDEAAVKRWLDSMTNESLAFLPTAAAAWQTEWPSEILTGLVRLCLTDPNFPGFVGQVEKALDLLNEPTLKDKQDNFEMEE
ncbi:unnamed protein product [Schistocephalus solidus]|uniref:TIR domain-containing protein n=1 Tax=Schistocephalus solidus TaxID=70667 RepID=A0A183SJE1_SCHSO|nr:unnamed protein product [Schistocephalus solidus]